MNDEETNRCLIKCKNCERSYVCNARKLPANKNLQIANVHMDFNKLNLVIVIEWCSDCGCGDYTIYKDRADSTWKADSEGVDSNKDKEFIKELLRLFADELTIVS